MSTAAPSEQVVARLLTAVAERDPTAAAACFVPGGTWQNVPHPPAVGRAGIVALLSPILERSDEVRWDVVSACYTSERAWVERVDRFVIDGTEHAVRCNGVFDIDPATGLIVALRDYVDLGEWRTRIAEVL